MFRGSDGAPKFVICKIKKNIQSRRKGKIFMDGVIVIRFLANSRGENILFENKKWEINFSEFALFRYHNFCCVYRFELSHFSF